MHKFIHTLRPWLLSLLVAFGGALILTAGGCEDDQGPIEEAAEEAGDEIEEATD